MNKKITEMKHNCCLCIMNCFTWNNKEKSVILLSLYRKINIKETRQANNFYLILRSNNTLNKIYFWKFKKNRRMRILGACIFLSLLAGKLEYFEQPILRKKRRRGNVVWAPVFFLSLLAGKLNPFNQMLP